MLSKLPSIFSLFLLLSCTSTGDKRYTALKADYKTSAEELVGLINSKNPGKSELILLSEKTMAKARPILKEFTKMKPQCAKLVEFMIANESAMKNLTPSVLESDYHEGEALPKFSDECHDIKEILVHPATVISLAKHKSIKESKEQMFDEMEEVLSHLDTL